MIARPVVDLPQPDSPTSPRVSPFEHVEADVGDRVHPQAGVAERELDDELLDASAAGRSSGREVGGAAAGHRQASAGAAVVPAESTSAAACSAERGAVAGERFGAFGRADGVEARERVAWDLGLLQRRLLLAAPVLGVRDSAARTGSPAAG